MKFGEFENGQDEETVARGNQVRFDEVKEAAKVSIIKAFGEIFDQT